MIRRPRPDEIKLLPQIENAADRRFRRVGLTHVDEMTPASIASLEYGRRHGLLWVAVSRLNRVVGFALMKVRGGTFWLDQLSVLDRFQGQGLGGALIERCAATARARGHDTLYLSTYRGVAWNKPFYERRGLVEVARGSFNRPLRVVLLSEQSHGHPVWRRATMRLSLRRDS